MKKIYLLILIFLCVILASCSERTLTFDRKYPDTSKIDELRIKKGEEIIKGKVSTEFSHLLGSNVAPDTIKTTYKIKFNEQEVTYQYYTNPLQYCWRKTVEECNHLTPVNLHINTSPLESTGFQITKVVLHRGHRITLNLFNIIEETPLADDVELYILEKDGSLTPYQITKLNKYNYVFELPHEIDTYIFMVKEIFSTNIGGIAYYPMYFTLK